MHIVFIHTKIYTHVTILLKHFIHLKKQQKKRFYLFAISSSTLRAATAAAAAACFAPALWTLGGSGTGGTKAASALVRGGTKRARAAADPTTAALGFGAVGGGIAPAPAPSVGEIE
jgi:hypothetical protein